MAYGTTLNKRWTRCLRFVERPAFPASVWPPVPAGRKLACRRAPTQLRTPLMNSRHHPARLSATVVALCTLVLGCGGWHRAARARLASGSVGQRPGRCRRPPAAGAAGGGGGRRRRPPAAQRHPAVQRHPRRRPARSDGTHHRLPGPGLRHLHARIHPGLGAAGFGFGGGHRHLHELQRQRHVAAHGDGRVGRQRPERALGRRAARAASGAGGGQRGSAGRRRDGPVPGDPGRRLDLGRCQSHRRGRGRDAPMRGPWGPRA